ncbi:MAG: glycosyltransferase family 4 protein [Porticoccaceae bacterium]|nr:glycosyltransferase family 4 protein [Porticoccaceae bacterium]
MKILFVHNRYKQGGGEDSVMDAEIKLLAEMGLLVFSALKDNNEIDSFKSKLQVFWEVAHSRQSLKWMREKIRQYEPDIVHIHNFFPLLTPSIYDACIDAGVPVVQTLHNYRTMCPGGLLMRDGKVCEKCIKGSAYQAVLHGCYRESAIGSLAVARMVAKHRSMGTWQHKVNRFIALTEFAKNKFIEAGFPEHKIAVKSNFVVDAGLSEDVNPNKAGALFVGRLSQEKGMETLLNAWRSLNVSLRVAGAGPLEGELANLTGDKVEALGMLNQDSVRKEMGQAAFLVMPSECYEGFPMVLVEAFSQGLPIIASRLGGMAEIVTDGVTGLHFEAGNANDLADKVRWMASHPEESRQMGRNARREYEEKYTPDKNYEILMDIYNQAIEDNKQILNLEP